MDRKTSLPGADPKRPAPENDLLSRRDPILYRSDRFDNRFLYEVLPDGAWEGRPCVIVGGGPSLRGFDFSRLKGFRTIGINRAFEFFDPTIIFSMDTRFLNFIYQGRYERIPDGAGAREKFHQSTSYKVWLCTYTVKLPAEIFIVRVFRNYKDGLRAFPMTSRAGIGHGNNSGYGALNLAVCLGANPIYLLGFDCKHSDGRSHFHDGHPRKQKEETAVKFAKFFEPAAQACRQKKTTVINLNPDSGLEAFPKRSPEEVLN